MTVPPLFGWEHILLVVVLSVVVAALVFLALAAGRAPSGRTEWQAYLRERSAVRRDGAGGAGTAQPEEDRGGPPPGYAARHDRAG
jgi:hypothetical protein